MTRETKIGLIVGLTFIIAVGILLSDHLSSNAEPAPAPLQLAGSAVRSSLGDPADADPVAGPAAPVVRVPRAIAMAQPIVTAAELTARAHRRPAATVVPSAPEPEPAPQSPPTAMAVQPADANNAQPMVLPSADPALIAVAHQNGQDLVPADGRTVPPSVVRRPAAVRTVVAESGDSLADLAERAYGSNTRTTREAILSANPGLKAAPDKIVAGRSYAAPVADARSITALASSTTTTTPAAAQSGTVVYIVQAGDTLWSIAAQHVGSPRAVAAIRDLNRDVLHGDHLRLHMKLRLPKGKATAE